MKKILAIALAGAACFAQAQPSFVPEKIGFAQLSCKFLDPIQTPPAAIKIAEDKALTFLQGMFFGINAQRAIERRTEIKMGTYEEQRGQLRRHCMAYPEEDLALAGLAMWQKAVTDRQAAPAEGGK